MRNIMWKVLQPPKLQPQMAMRDMSTKAFHRILSH
jgi:hypothetical protein